VCCSDLVDGRCGNRSDPRVDDGGPGGYRTPGASAVPGPLLRLSRGLGAAYRLFGHVPECLRRLRVAVSGEGGQAGGCKDELVDRRLIVLLEIAEKPTGRDPRMPTWVFAGDQQRQRECVFEPESG
jgi:hypothetical protein